MVYFELSCLIFDRLELGDKLGGVNVLDFILFAFSGDVSADIFFSVAHAFGDAFFLGSVPLPI